MPLLPALFARKGVAECPIFSRGVFLLLEANDHETKTQAWRGW
jgi:hypothetical protein